ncbi:MAG: hypothetical protein ACLQI7_15010 [Streptosporangiaceae bacterium]
MSMPGTPTAATVRHWMVECGGCEARDGCWVDPAGTCEHGEPSWALVLGLLHAEGQRRVGRHRSLPRRS